MEMVMFEAWVRPAVEGIECKMPELRDLFAMNALSGFCVAHEDDGDIADWNYEKIAECSYAAEDAMLKARKKK